MHAVTTLFTCCEHVVGMGPPLIQAGLAIASAVRWAHAWQSATRRLDASKENGGVNVRTGTHRTHRSNWIHPASTSKRVM